MASYFALNSPPTAAKGRVASFVVRRFDVFRASGAGHCHWHPSAPQQAHCDEHRELRKM